MRFASIAEVETHLGEYVAASATELVVITRDGDPVAVLLPITDAAELDRLASTRPRRLQAILEEASRQVHTTGGIPHTEFWARVDAENAAGKGD